MTPRGRILRAVQLLLGHTKLGSTVRDLGIEVDDALSISEQVELRTEMIGVAVCLERPRRSSDRPSSTPANGSSCSANLPFAISRASRKVGRTGPMLP
jgi:hypothetical protein